MSDVTPPGGPGPSQQPEYDLGQGATVGSRLTTALKAGGVVAPILTVVVAFIVGGLVVLITGHNPFDTYKAIFDGTGLQWLFPWTSGADRDTAAVNLQQTLLITGPLILLGLAVGYAFRAGLFNIGGQGQYIVGSIVAVWSGSSWAGMPHLPHVVLCMLLATAAGAAWAAIAGALRAFTGANEVITTIMLNWIAIWLGVYLFSLGGPLQNSSQPDVPISNDVVPSAKLHVFWGDPELQGLHIGIFVAVAAAVVYWVLLNRSTKGYEARAVGFNPEAARYSGIKVGKTYVLVMGTCGALAGLAGSLDVLGWQFHLATNDIQTTQLAFLGIAVALLGRNTAIGTCLAALLFGALVNGTSVRNLDPQVFEPELAQNLTTVIQGLVVLFVSADVLILMIYNKLRPRRRRAAAAGEPVEAGA
ncbi:MAG TPA: ABC transporter permease [Baekduia sp.]|uniref:ABC transporter permease n=1 Tax=Baekduia sp. TaxID=2600305 RepID=UPI002D78035F|nr:ABC transporter permease [Baekduia sp.]HET6507130.1 ABC transporter permease [Baekduia sp.]